MTKKRDQRPAWEQAADPKPKSTRPATINDLARGIVYRTRKKVLEEEIARLEAELEEMKRKHRKG